MIDYETALLAASIKDEDAFYSARALRLCPASFIDEGCMAVWDCLCKNADDGIPHSNVELWMRVKREYPDRADEYEGQMSLACAEVDDIATAPKWAQSVADQWVKRKQDAIMEQMSLKVAEGEDKLAVMQWATDEFAAAEDSVALEENKLDNQRKAVMERAQARITGTGDVVRTGIPMIDRECGVFQSHEFMVLAARPGQGKSSLARQICIEHMRTQKRPVMLFSLEMSVDQVVQAMASQECGVSSWRIEDDFEHNQQKLIDTCERFAGALGKFLFVHDDVYKISDIEHEIVMAARRHKPSLIVIDYLQLIEPPHVKGMNREQQVAYMSRHLKQLAQRYRIPIIALAQMGREYEKEDRKPRLSDLRESGSLEQDADRVWFLHHQKDAEPVDGVTPIQLIQEKCRSGSQCELNIGFKKKTTKFIFDSPTNSLT